MISQLSSSTRLNSRHSRLYLLSSLFKDTRVLNFIGLWNDFTIKQSSISSSILLCCVFLSLLILMCLCLALPCACVSVCHHFSDYFLNFDGNSNFWKSHKTPHTICDRPNKVPKTFGKLEMATQVGTLIFVNSLIASSSFYNIISFSSFMGKSGKSNNWCINTVEDLYLFLNFFLR